jgi:hypothetical protein
MFLIKHKSFHKLFVFYQHFGQGQISKLQAPSVILTHLEVINGKTTVTVTVTVNGE